MVSHRAGGGEEVSVGGIIATVYFSVACCGKIVLRRSGFADYCLHAHYSSISESIRAMGSKDVPAPDTSRSRIGRHRPIHLGKLHAIGRAPCDTGCSGCHTFLRAGTTRIVCHVTTRRDITHTAANMTVRLVLVKGKALRHAMLATYARKGVANLPSPINLLQKWTGLRPEHALLFGLPEDGNDWQPGSLTSALQRSLHALTRCPPPGTTWTSHSLQIGAHTEQTLLGLPVEVRKARFGWGPDSDDMTSLYFDRQTTLSPASCWIFVPAMSGHTTPVPSR
jgi:hypothetical protein